MVFPSWRARWLSLFNEQANVKSVTAVTLYSNRKKL